MSRWRMFIDVLDGDGTEAQGIIAAIILGLSICIAIFAIVTCVILQPWLGLAGLLGLMAYGFFWVTRS